MSKTCDTQIRTSWGFYRIFYRAGQAYGRKTESGRCTSPHMDRWRGQGVAVPLIHVGPSSTASAASFSLKFLNILKLTEIIFIEFSESVYLPYHIPIPFSEFWILSEGFFYVLFRCNYLNNV